MLAVALESEEPSRFAALGEGIYLTNEAGKDIYSLSFSSSAEAIVSRSLSAEGVDRITTRFSVFDKRGM